MRDYFEGSIYLARQTIESDVFFNKPDKWFKIWIFLLLMANYKDNKQFKRGECFTNYDEIGYYTKSDRNSIDHCIRWLKSATMITTRKATRGFYVSILNYDKYQSNPRAKSDTKSDTESELKAKQKRHRGDTINNNDSNEKNENTTNERISFSSNSKFKYTPVDFKDPRNIEPTYRKIKGIKYRLAWNTENKRVCIPPERGKEYIPYEDLIKPKQFIINKKICQ